MQIETYQQSGFKPIRLIIDIESPTDLYVLHTTFDSRIEHLSPGQRDDIIRIKNILESYMRG